MPLKSLLKKRPRAILALADGSIFNGVSIGASGSTVGEVVFNTSLTGYQEIITDPSYYQQIVTLTYPHIGNVGVNKQDAESSQPWVAGLIIRELSPLVSNWRAEKSLENYLVENKVVAIAEIDTRRLTRLLREKGAQNGCISAEDISVEEAIKRARAFAGIQNADLAKIVSIKKSKTWNETTLKLWEPKTEIKDDFHVVVFDYGVKYQILRLLKDRGCKVTVVPAETTAETVLSLSPDGVVLSNGPGDPAACHYAIKATQLLIENNIPVFGICLGFQLMALACGAKTTKMKFGHHGGNHPVTHVQNKKVFITSQNHGFDVDEKTLPDTLEIVHRSLFDGSLQGISHRTKPAISFQGHPEASPGPREIVHLFDHFIELMKKNPVKRNRSEEVNAKTY